MRPALHRTIVIVDVAGFSDHRRTNADQATVRDGMYKALRRSFGKIGLSFDDCHHEDRGDGVLVLVPADVPKAVFSELLPLRLTEALRKHNERRPTEEQIRLRMVLHAGELIEDEHGVTGASVNLAFRLLDSRDLKSAISQSGAALALVVSSWYFDEVVRHSVRSKPWTYRQVHVTVKETSTTAWIRLPDTHPDEAPVTGPDRRHKHGPTAMRQTLPRDAAAFTGRKHELAQLLTAASAAIDSGQVMADGMAGVGKTALAVHVAHLLAHRFPDGQLYVRLHAHTPDQRQADPTDVLATLLSAAGVVEQHMPDELEPRAAMWREYLVGKKVLLILDDAKDHSQVEPLLPSSPGCLVMVTSRKRLMALDAAVTLPLDTLPPVDAVALFTRLSGRTVTDEAASHVAEIVRLTGYLPLAISLVARRLRHRPMWTIAHLAEDLFSTRGRMLEITAEDVAVAAAFDLSYRDLPDAQQRFLCHLGLHPGPEIDVYAAAALADVSPSVARDHLEALYNDHLLDESAPGRYRMHDLVRDYIRTRVREDMPDDRGAAVTRLLDHYQETARVAEEGMYGKFLSGNGAAGGVNFSTHGEALAWMHTERLNLIACVHSAASLELWRHVVLLEGVLTCFLWVTGPWDQAVLVLLQVSAPRGEQHSFESIRRAYALNWRGEGLRKAGNFSGAIDAHSRALEIYEQQGRPDLRPRIASTLNFLGIARLATGDLRGAIQVHKQAQEIFRSLGYPLPEAYVLNELGVAYRVVGEFELARQSHDRALKILSEFGAESDQAFALLGLGAVWRATGNFDEAVRMHEQALDIYRALGKQVGEADALDELGAAVGATGDYKTADEMHSKALALYCALSHVLGQAETHNNRGVLLLESGHPAQAKAEHESALELAKEVDSLLEEARALHGMARCELEIGRPDHAAAQLEQASVIYQRIGAAEAAATIRELAALTTRRQRTRRAPL